MPVRETPVTLVENSVENISKEHQLRLIEARNCQSSTLIASAKELLRQATEVDLSNIATEILMSYPQIHTITLVEDQRKGYEGIIFAGHVDDENGNKIEGSFEAKNFIEELLATYHLADPAFVTNRFINLREYADKSPEWFHSVASNGYINFKVQR